MIYAHTRLFLQHAPLIFAVATACGYNRNIDRGLDYNA